MPQAKTIWKVTSEQFGDDSDSMRPLAFDIDKKDGKFLFLTTWRGGGNLYAEKWNASNGTRLEQTGFGNATQAEMEAKTYYIVPNCPFLHGADWGNHLWVFGRWNDGGIKHLSLSGDGAQTFTHVGEGTWGANHRVGGIRVHYDEDTVWAFINHASPRLWETPDQGTTWSNINSMPFSIEFTSLDWFDQTFLIGRNAAGAMMAAWIRTPYTGSWTDATGSPSLPIDNPITAITWIR